MIKKLWNTGLGFRLVTALGLIVGLLSVGQAKAEVYADLYCTSPTTRIDGSYLDIAEINSFRFYDSTDGVNFNFQIGADAIVPEDCRASISYDLPASPDSYTLYFVYTAVATCGVDPETGVTIECESAYSEVVTKTFLVRSTADPSRPGGAGGSMRAGPGYVVEEIE